MSYKDPFPFKAFFECQTCNGVMSEIDINKQSLTVLENETREGLSEHMLNNYPKCEHCGKNLIRTK